MSDLDHLPPSARLWLFALDGDVPDGLLADVRAFCAQWTTHGRAVPAAADALAGCVVAVAAQLSDADVNAGVSGCGIDAMQHAVEAAAERHGRALVPALSVAFRGADGLWQTATRPAFRRLVAAGEAGVETCVLDLTPVTLGALRDAGGPERRAADTWHAVAFRLAASAGAGA